MLTMLGRVTSYFSLLLGRDDAFRDPDGIRSGISKRLTPGERQAVIDRCFKLL
jgi:hypothetical protein